MKTKMYMAASKHDWTRPSKRTCGRGSGVCVRAETVQWADRAAQRPAHLLVRDEDAPRLGEVVEARGDGAGGVRRVAVVLAPEDRDHNAADREEEERRVEGRHEAEGAREGAREKARDDGDKARAKRLQQQQQQQRQEVTRGGRGAGNKAWARAGHARTMPENVLLIQSSENERARCSWIIHVSKAEKRMEVATPPRRRPIMLRGVNWAC